MSYDNLHFKDNTLFLVTGGAGFIGSNLCEAILKLGYRVRCLDDLSTGKQANVDLFIDNPNYETLNEVLETLAKRYGTPYNSISTDYKSRVRYEYSIDDISINVYEEENDTKKLYVYEDNKEVFYCDFNKDSIRYTYGRWTYKLERIFNEKLTIQRQLNK